MDAQVSGGSIEDDGTDIVFKFAGVTYLKIKKSDKQIKMSLGFDTDEGY